MRTFETRVVEIVSEQLGVKMEDVFADCSFADDLGADSLDLVELVLALDLANSPSLCALLVGYNATC